MGSIVGLRKGDQQAGRATNRRLILNLLRTRGQLSRSQLSQLTGLSPAATGFVAKELLDDGYLVSGEPESERAGRKRVPLALNTDENFAIGVHLSVGKVDCVLTDLAANVVVHETIDTESMDPEVVVAAAETAVGRVIQSKPESARTLGVGLAGPGVFDPVAKSCVRNFRFGWKDVPIGTMLADAIQLPVSVENDTRACGIAHQLFGLGKNRESFLMVAIGAGIGCAMIQQDHVLRAMPGKMGEVGHILAAEDGPICECGRKGCLQTLYSLPALKAKWRSAGYEVSLKQAVKTSDPDAIDFVAQAGRGIGRHMSDWVTLFGPEIIILGGGSVQLGPSFVNAIKEEMDRTYFLDEGPEIFVDEGRFHWTAGAAAITIQNLFVD